MPQKGTKKLLLSPGMFVLSCVQLFVLFCGEALAQKFDFGKQVVPQTIYSRESGFGFEPGADVNCGRDSCSSEKPFYFSVKVPEGNYNVRITFGPATTVKAELRRLMIESTGKPETRTITVNVRTPAIANGGEVKLKERETTTEIWGWDEKLTLEFSGSKPTVSAIEVTRADDVPTIFLLGDSTVADQPREPYNSWGQMLTRFFKPGVSIANHAESGESLRSSLGAKRLDKVLSVMKPGDYLFIQYGHNDEKEKGEGVGPFTTYKADLKKFVQGARQRGGIPVLITPVQRRTFGSDGKITNSHGDYPEAVRQVSKEENVPLIDLNLTSKALYETWGPEKSKEFFAPNDNTHHNDEGSYEIAKLIVAGIRANKLGISRRLR